MLEQGSRSTGYDWAGASTLARSHRRRTERLQVQIPGPRPKSEFKPRPKGCVMRRTLACASTDLPRTVPICRLDRFADGRGGAMDAVPEGDGPLLGVQDVVRVFWTASLERVDPLPHDPALAPLNLHGKTLVAELLA